MNQDASNAGLEETVVVSGEHLEAALARLRSYGAIVLGFSATTRDYSLRVLWPPDHELQRSLLGQECGGER